jgi:tetratricopeptide (TPR) repeat protein
MKVALVLFAVLLLALPSLAREDVEILKSLFKEANVFMGQGKHAEALAKYQAVLAIEPKAKGSLYNGGLAAYLLGKHDLAIGLWTRLKVITPKDWELHTKLVQVYEATGKKASRDAEIKALYALRKDTTDPDLAKLRRFCRDQFKVGERKVLAYEHFEWVGERAVRYYFAVMNKEGKKEFHISLGSYAYMQSFAEEMGTVEKGQRYCHLDGYYPGGRHATFGMFKGEPSYDDMKAKVIAILKQEAAPVSSSTPGTPRKKDEKKDEEKDGD